MSGVQERDSRGMAAPSGTAAPQGAEQALPATSPKLLGRLRDALRSRHYSRRTEDPTRWGGLALIAVAAVGVGAALYLSRQSAESLKYEQEWVKALLQAGLIAVLGVVTSGVLESFKDGLQRKRDQSKLRCDVLTDVGRIYMDVKLVRRRAQAAGALNPAYLPELNEQQVCLELHKYHNVALFEKRAGLGAALGKMARYLNKVANKPESDERLHFIDPEGFSKFSTAFHKVTAIMQQDIAGTESRRVRHSNEKSYCRREA